MHARNAISHEDRSDKVGGTDGGGGQTKPTTYRQNLDVVALVLQIAGEILQSRLDLRGKVQKERSK